MKTSMKQMFRRPVFIISFILLLALGCAFLCVSAGLWASARLSAAGADSMFTTIAALNAVEFRQMRFPDSNPPKHNPELYDKAWEAGAKSDYVRFTRQDGSLRAYSPELIAPIDPYVTEKGLDEPYRCTVAVATFESAQIAMTGAFATFNATFRIDHEVFPSIHPALSDLDYITCMGSWFAENGEIPFKKGEKYLLYCDTFSQRDGEMLVMISSSILCDKEYFEYSDDDAYTYEYDPATNEVGEMVLSEETMGYTGPKKFIVI